MTQREHHQQGGEAGETAGGGQSHLHNLIEFAGGKYGIVLGEELRQTSHTAESGSVRVQQRLILRDGDAPACAWNRSRCGTSTPNGTRRAATTCSRHAPTSTA